MKLKLIYILIFLHSLSLSMAQDIHFSQFNASPLNMNPALTGLFNSDFRIILNHKNQWSSITTPFVTYSGTFDMNIVPSHSKSSFIGAGVLFNADRAGDISYTTLQLSPSLSYTRVLYQNKLFLSYGMQVGVLQRHFNPNALTFDKQYSGDIYDPSLSTGEQLAATTALTLDAATGVNVFWIATKRLFFNTGFAIHHLNKPNLTFSNGAHSQISTRYTIHGSSTIHFTNALELLPGYIIQKQGANSEYIVGTYIRLAATEQIAIFGGIWDRIKDHDALILSTRIDYINLSLGISYDLNTSKLSSVSSAQGGLELSLIYLFDKVKLSSKNKPIKCPVFF